MIHCMRLMRVRKELATVSQTELTAGRPLARQKLVFCCS
ncbi:hypothetical protein C5167_028213 [Papaver somniferum]|nr:hypothetical protein C5167_028213 [Papaver somniferum]